MTKKEYASRYLYGKIQTGQIKVGGKLPSENALAIKLNISRLTAREAFKSLEKNGIIKGEHGKGYFVSQNINQLSFSSLKSQLSVNRTKMELKPGLKIENFFGIEHKMNQSSVIAYSKKYFKDDDLKIATVTFLNKKEIWEFDKSAIEKSLLDFLIEIGNIPSVFKETLVFGSHPYLDELAKEIGYDNRYPIFVTRLKSRDKVNIEYALRIYKPEDLRIKRSYKII